MQIPKPSDDDKARFRALVPADARVEIKPMFGNLGAFVNGNMFMGLFGSDIGVKLPADEAGRLIEAGGGSFGPAERPMTGYVSLPGSTTEQQAMRLVEQSLAYVSEMPPKKPRGARKSAR
jgi:TfoX/Sxy family transcriptional regulator of competence genes